MARQRQRELNVPSWVSPSGRLPVDASARLVPTEPDKSIPAPPPGKQYSAWWVPFGEGWEIPAAFQYDGGGPFDWSMWIHVVDGKAECVALKCWSPQGRRPVTAEALRRLPLARLVREGILCASRPANEVPKRQIFWPNVEAALREREAVADQLRRSRPNPREGRAVTDELLERVAAIYREALPGGAPTKAVAETLNYSRASAGRLVMQARAGGLLPKTEPRRARA